MADRLTDRIRSFVIEEYVNPARLEGRTKLTVRVRDVRSAFSKGEPMRGQSSVICQALQSKKFMAESHMVVESIDGPPSKKSPTVVMHYELIAAEATLGTVAETMIGEAESPEEWASRLVGKIYGLRKIEFAEYGGGEAFLRWVRSEEGKPR